jgi:hypothetical protein
MRPTGRSELVTSSLHASLDTGSRAGTRGQPGVEIQLFSDDEFPVRDEIMALQIGARQFFLSGYPNGDLKTVVSTLTEEEFAAVSSGEPVIVPFVSHPRMKFGSSAISIRRSWTNTAPAD